MSKVLRHGKELCMGDPCDYVRPVEPGVHTAGIKRWDDESKSWVDTLPCDDVFMVEGGIVHLSDGTSVTDGDPRVHWGESWNDIECGARGDGALMNPPKPDRDRPHAPSTQRAIAGRATGGSGHGQGGVAGSVCGGVIGDNVDEGKCHRYEPRPTSSRPGMVRADNWQRSHLPRNGCKLIHEEHDATAERVSI